MVEKSSTTRIFIALLTSALLSQPVAPAREPRLQARQRLAMYLADPRFTHLQHGANFLQVQLVVVIQGHDRTLALRQAGDGLGQRGAESLVEHVAERVRVGVGGVDLALFRREARYLATGRVLDDLVVLIEAHTHLGGDVRVARLATDLGLELADRVRHDARLAMYRARRPIELAQPVEHRATNPYAGVGLETRS